ncbi:MAG: phage protein Gp37 [Phycisphaerae bacterium]
MSQLAELENALVAAIGAISSEGSAVFASVSGFSGPLDGRLREMLQRQRKPAAVVAYLGQTTGAQRWAVVVSAEGLRGPDEPRLGSSDVYGAFELLRLLRQSLDGQTLGSGDRLALAEERLIAADERAVISQQTYEADRPSAAPTFDGQAICGQASRVAVTVGPVEKETVKFGFVGIDGAYQHELGLRGRQIVWSGRLQAADSAALDAIEATLEGYVAEAGEHDLTDGSGRTFEHCVLESFERRSPRRVDPATGQTSEAFRLIFKQLDPT